MPDLLNRLAAMDDDTASTTDDATVAADLRRGHQALAGRRRRRTGVAAAASLAMIAAGSLSYASTATDGGSASGRTASASIQLVDYHGPQTPGFVVTKVPRNYVVHGIDRSVVEVSRKGDRSPIYTFANKLVFMMDDDVKLATHGGKRVMINGHAGRFFRDPGVPSYSYLEFNNGKHNVQVWASDIYVSDTDMVEFAAGVQVLPSAVVGHG